MDRLQTAQGPLADYIRQARSFLPGVFGQAQQIGTQVASQAPQLYNQLQGQISGFLQSLPNLQQHAQQSVEQAYSPLQSNTLFQNAMQQALQQSRGAAAGRGLTDSGMAQAGEQGMSRDLAAQFAQNQFANQQAALQGAVGVGQAGIQPAAMGMNALPAYAQLLQSAYGIPAEALGQVFGMISGGMNPSMALLSQTLPQIAQKASSKSSGGNIL